MNGDPQHCPVCAGTPTVLVAVAHPTLRALTVELLEREHGCWRARALAEPSGLAGEVRRAPPDLVVIDAGDFPRCCREVLDGFPSDRVVVVGPEPDPAYERAARRAGAGAWVARDRVAEDLSAGMRAALGCSHVRCPDDIGGVGERPEPAVVAAAPTANQGETPVEDPR